MDPAVVGWPKRVPLVVATRRTRLFWSSARYVSPAPLVTSPSGVLHEASVAGLPSPPYPEMAISPAHATVVSVPDGASDRPTMAVPSPMSSDPEPVAANDTGSWAIVVPGPTPVPPITVDTSAAAADAVDAGGVARTAVTTSAAATTAGRGQRRQATCGPSSRALTGRKAAAS